MEVKDSKCSTWSKCGDVSADKTMFIANNLLEGHDYLFRVSAVNEKGPGAPLESLNFVRLEKSLGKFLRQANSIENSKKIVQGQF